jgi:hypothetical protein
MGGNAIRVAIALIGAVAALALGAGCGGGDSTATTVSAATEGSTPEEAVSTDASEMEAIESTIKTWIMQGDCDLMTDHFLEEQTFSDDPVQACKTFKKLFTPPSYTEDAIEVSDVTYANDKATATVVGGTSGLTAGGEEITSTYKLVRTDDGTWQINSADID